MQTLVLNADEESSLLQVPAGNGGFQSLIKKLQKQFDPQTKELILQDCDLEKIPRYAFDHKGGGWQSRLKMIFERHLGHNLGR
ncbi:hypothetical protein AGMMS49959_14440 [Planctomycetales bacterium]|nr:hypothetical protein AGMMS49959_14440 [Planctomycetales bacterium]